MRCGRPRTPRTRGDSLCRASGSAQSRRLGHARVEITLGIYGHLLPGGDESAAGTVANRILGAHKDLDEEPDSESSNGPDDEDPENA